MTEKERRLPPAEALKWDSMMALDILSEKDVLAEFSDTAERCHISSTECHVVYPAAFPCESIAGSQPCRNKVTAHVAAFCKKHGAGRPLLREPVRCAQHVDWWYCKREGGVWQDSVLRFPNDDTKEHVAVDFSKVGSLMMGEVSVRARNLVEVRLEDAVLPGLHLAVTLYGEKQPTEPSGWAWAIRGGVQGRLRSTPADNLHPRAVMERTDQGHWYIVIRDSSGATIRVRVDRAIGVLITMRAAAASQESSM